ncbi:hypothetical protein SAY87_029951 [Trapa incisa]|uniref:RING-type E3 ubiquitin transferase n=1 Tax=Trapa incisa TaxID=236973 RepID=A0AAN7KE20_9MYRT|nr:hypothetical protein SAY87_029951 [Trapa incisa]
MSRPMTPDFGRIPTISVGPVSRETSTIITHLNVIPLDSTRLSTYYMALHQFMLSAKVRLNENDISEASSSEEEEDEEEDGLVLFQISYKNQSLTPVRPTVYGRKIKEECVNRTASTQFRRSELMDFDDSTETEEELTSLAADLVPDLWVEELGKQLVWLAREVGNRLNDGLATGPRLSAAPLLVEVDLITVMLAKSEECGPTLEDLESEARSRYPSVYVPATPSSIEELETFPADDLEDDDHCSICVEALDRTITESGGSSEEITKMPCSHEYHSSCILEWLKMNHVCPLCRFELPHYVLAIADPEITYNIASP